MIGQTTDVKLIVQYYLHEIWHRRWIALAVAWVICLGGLIHVAQLDDEYQSQTRIYVDTESLLLPLMQGLAVQPDPQEQIEFLRRTLLTRPNLEQLVTDTNLDLKITTLDSRQRTIERERLIDRLRSRINVSQDGRSLFRIAYTDKDPETARDVTQGLLTIFREQNVGENRADLVQTRRFIDRQVEEYEGRLRDAERRVTEFRIENADALRRSEGVSGRLQTTEANIRGLEVELQSAIWTRNQIEAQMAQVPKYLADVQEGETVGPVAFAPPTNQCEQLAENRRIMLESVTEAHPQIRSIDRTIRGLGCDAGGTETGEDEEPLTPQYAQLLDAHDRTEQAIENIRQRMLVFQEELSELQRQAAEVPEVQLRLQQLNRDYDAVQSTYNSLIERRERARLAQSLENESTSIEFRVVEPPILPPTPSGPDRLQLSLFVLALSVAGGLGSAVGLIQLNNSFRTVHELRQVLKLPVLGCITNVSAGVRNRVALIEAPIIVVLTSLLFVTVAVFVHLYHFRMWRLEPSALLAWARGLIG